MHQTTEQRQLVPVPSPEQQALDALQQFREVLGNMGHLRDSLYLMQQAGFSLTPNSRKLKIQPYYREQGIHENSIVPKLTLCGEWLRQAGFEVDRHARIITMQQLIIICPERKPDDRKRRWVQI